MPRDRVTLAALLRVSVFVVLSQAFAGGASAQPGEGGKSYPKEAYFDFRGKPIPPELTVEPAGAGQYARAEPEGLRVTLPKDRKNLAPFDLIVRVGVQGDFDITAKVEILQADKPREGFGVGVSLFVNKVDPPTEAASVGRLLRPSGADILFWDQGFGKPGEQMQFDFESRPCTDKQLRLRPFQRTGSQLAYFLGAGLQGETYQALPPKNFGPNDIERVLLRITTGRERYNVDVRLIDLRIRSGRKPDSKETPAAEVPVVKERRTGSRIWLAAALLLALALTFVLVIALGLWIRRRRNATDEES